MYLFCREDGGKPESNRDITGQSEKRNKRGIRTHAPGPWHVLHNKVGLPNAHIHWTRHTFAVQALKTKILEPQQVAGAMGILLRTLYGHYAKYISDEHVAIDRKIDLFAG